MTARRVVVVWDGTVLGDLAFRVALAAARDRCAELHVIRFLEAVPVAADMVMEPHLRRDCLRSLATLREVRERCTNEGVVAHAELVHGHPIDHLAHTAARLEADVVVLGCGRRMSVRGLADRVVAWQLRRRGVDIISVGPGDTINVAI